MTLSNGPIELLSTSTCLDHHLPNSNRFDLTSSFIVCRQYISSAYNYAARMSLLARPRSQPEIPPQTSDFTPRARITLKSDPNACDSLSIAISFTHALPSQSPITLANAQPRGFNTITALRSCQEHHFFSNRTLKQNPRAEFLTQTVNTWW